MGIRLFFILLLIIARVGGEDAGQRFKAREESLKNLTLRIDPKGWGDAQVNDIMAVLHSSTAEFAVHFTPEQIKAIEPIRIRNDKAGPMTVFKRTIRGEILVLLDTRDRFWCQYAYQMAHELGHVFCRNKEADRTNLWFEESLCELASIFVMQQMEVTWKTHPPYANWKSYSESISEYVDDVILKYTPEEKLDLASWYVSNAEELKTNPTNRKLNGLVALELLPLFEEDPKAWGAISYINIGVDQTPKSFAEYLKAWRDNCPESYQPFVAGIGQKFGIEL